MDKKIILGGLLLIGVCGLNQTAEGKTNGNQTDKPSDNWAKKIAQFGDYPEGHIKESFLGSNKARTLSECNNIGSIKQFRSNGTVISPNAPWRGAVPWQQNTDGTFVQFTSFAWGLRACILLLKNYITKYNRNTLRKIVQYWDLGNPQYLTHLVTNTGFGADQILVADKRTLQKIVRYIGVMEQGWANDVVTDKRFQTAYALL